MNELAGAKVGGGGYPHAGGANIGDGCILTLIVISPLAIRSVDGEQDWRIFGESLARSFFALCAHGLLYNVGWRDLGAIAP